MLFAKPISELTFEDIEEFCKRFREGTRVEYKSTFDDNVKRKLPRVLSSFANFNGGIVIVGINAPDGVPEEPFEGIAFPDREPGLTVQSICRENIFPEIPLYTKFVSGRLPDKAFLAIEVNESSKAPHAIENSTQVYVRTDGGTDRTSLADITIIERMLRRDILGRWNDFYADSEILAKTVGFPLTVPHFELKIGPQYPSDAIVTRERVSEFLSDHTRRYNAGFLQEVLRHPAGAFLSRNESNVRYLNIGEIGTVHYLEQLELRQLNENVLPSTGLWWIVRSILKSITIAADLMTTHGITCDLRVEATLRRVAEIPFYVNTHRGPFPEMLSAVFQDIPAYLIHPSETFAQRAKEVAIELLYQLRWPLGGRCDRGEVRQAIAGQLGA